MKPRADEVVPLTLITIEDIDINSVLTGGGLGLLGLLLHEGIMTMKAFYSFYDGKTHERAVKMDMSDDVIPEFDFNPYVLENKIEYLSTIVETAISKADKAETDRKNAETAVEQAQAAADKLMHQHTHQNSDNHPAVSGSRQLH